MTYQKPIWNHSGIPPPNPTLKSWNSSETHIHRPFPVKFPIKNTKDPLPMCWIISNSSVWDFCLGSDKPTKFSSFYRQVVGILKSNL